MTNLYASWFVHRRCDINKVVQGRVRGETRLSNEHAMPELHRVVLVRLAIKARNEKLAVGMGDCTVVVEKLLSCGHLSPFLWYIDVYVNNPTRRWILQPES